MSKLFLHIAENIFKFSINILNDNEISSHLIFINTSGLSKTDLEMFRTLDAFGMNIAEGKLKLLIPMLFRSLAAIESVAK